MRFAQDPVLADSELLPGGELSLAGVAGEAGEVVDLVLGLPDPVRRGNGAAALEALGPKQSERDEAAHVMIEYNPEADEGSD